MLRSIFLKSLWEQRRSLPLWALGLVGLTFITVLFYPSISDMTEINALLGDEDSIMRVFVGDISDMTSPEGYLNSQLYYLMIPLLFLVFGITQGSGAIAGEEERGTLDLLLSNPLTRSQVFTHKFTSMGAAITVLAFILWLGTVGSVIVVDIDIAVIRLAEITLSAALLGLLFGTMSLTVGGATGKRGTSIAIASVLAVAAYFLNALVPVVDTLEPLSKLSPFYYYIDSDPLTNGLDFLHVMVLMGVTVVLLLIGFVTFGRRDLGV